MIIVYLKGGLGNQMFQYAVGRHLAHINNTELKMDISAYNYDGPLEYALGPFNVNTSFAGDEEIAKLKEITAGGFEKFVYGLFHKSKMQSKSFVRYNKPDFNPSILRHPDNVYIEGYYNSEKYFIQIEQIIRDEFSFKEAPSGKNKEVADMIAQSNAVSLHIRRGDYVADPTKHTSHGFCGLEYYQRSIEKILGKVDDPTFFVFSDSADWCRENLKIGHNVVYVDHNNMDTCHEDMRLMSLCRHNIIANSTFSWWGAWLNGNPDKMVFAPKQWFARSDKNPKDIIPESWIKL